MKKVIPVLKQSRAVKVLLSLLTSAVLIFNPVVSLVQPVAYASPVVASPVSGGLIGELLVALGLMTGNDDTGFDWRTDTSFGRDIYTTDIFGNVVPKIKSGDTCTDEDLAPLLGTVIPEGVYSQASDGSFEVAGKAVTPSDIFIKAKSIIGVTYGLPVNVYSISSYSPRTEGVYNGWYSPVSSSDVNNGNCFIPIYGYKGTIIFNCFGLAIFPSRISLYKFSGKNCSDNLGSGGSSIPRFISSGNRSVTPFVLGVDSPSIDGNYRASTSSYGGGVAWDVFDNSYVLSNIWDEIEYSTFAVTKGLPVDTIIADEKELETSVVKVTINNYSPIPPDGGGDNKPDKTVVVPVPPVWELWESIADLIKEISDGTDTNNGTTLGGYINNNYNYQSVDVSVNVPDKIDVGLSGGLDINGKGDINVNIHESLPSVSSGDGSGFFGAEAVDVLAGLTTDNPVIGTVEGLFSALDPALVGIFSVSVSLFLLLGLWKLIRG